jgi:hypothetical protein
MDRKEKQRTKQIKERKKIYKENEREEQEL